MLASHYRVGTVTASEERFNPNGSTAALHDYPLGTTITVLNPQNGRSCSVRINDRGPYGIAHEMGAKTILQWGRRIVWECTAQTAGSKMRKNITRFLKNESGATAIEYGLIAAGIALAIITVVNSLGTNVNSMFSSINASLK